MANNLLLVPIQVDSLFLQKDSLMAEPTADFSRLPFFNGRRDVNPDVAYISENFIAPPFQNRNQRFRAGLHLHWALPDAMTRGLIRDTDPDDLPGGMPLPAVPDRWLIRRHDGLQWMVESNFLWPDENVYALLESVKDLLKKALRRQRSFEMEVKKFGDSIDAKLIDNYQQEMLDILTTLNNTLENILSQPGTDFFEPLSVLMQSWQYGFSVRSRMDEMIDDFAQRLESCMYDFFDRRKDAVSYPVRPEDIRRPDITDGRIAAQRVFLKIAARNANILHVMGDRLSIEEKNAIKQEIRRQLTSFVDAFIERVTPTSGINGLNGKTGRLLARSVTIPADQAANKPQKTFRQFYELKDTDINEILNRTGGGVFGPAELFLLKAGSIDGPGFRDFRENIFSPADVLQKDIDSPLTDTLVEKLLSMLREYRGPGDAPPPAPAHHQPYRYVGRAYQLLNNFLRTDSTQFEYLKKLTTLGYGEPTFAAFYPNCHSIFGFFDPEIKNTDKPTYHVLGWYDQAGDELLPFLNTLHNSDDLPGLLKEKAGWNLPDNADIDISSRIICFGKIEHDALKDGTQEQNAAGAQIAIANTGQEALAALLAAKLGASELERKQIEDQLEALFLNDAFANRQLDIWPKFLETRHEQGFNAEPGERIWRIQLKRVEIAHSPEAGNTNTSQSPALTDEIAAQLSSLNQKQRALDLAVFQRESLREQLFSDWYKYMLSAYPPQDSRLDYPDVDELRYFIEQFDIRPLLDLQYQTGMFSESPDQRWKTLGFQSDDERTWPTPAPLAAELMSLKKSLDITMRDHNETLSRLIQAGDITDWNRLIGALSRPEQERPAELNILFNRLRESEMGPALLLLQDIKTRILSTLNEAWTAEAADAIFILQRFGVAPEEGQSVLQEGNILQWNALLSILLSGKTGNANILSFRSRLPASLRNNIALFLEPAAGGSSAPAEQLALSTANVELMLDQLRIDINAAADPVGRRDQLATALNNAFRPAPRFELISDTGPRFWQPKEPSLLIAGDIAQASNRFGRDGRMGNGLLNLEDWQIQQQNQISPELLVELITLIDTHQPATDQEAIGYHRSDGAPWNPFMLEWSVELLPLQEHSNARDGEYQPDYVLHHYELPVNAVDLQEKPSPTIRGRNPNIYQGSSLLSADAFQNLSEKLSPYLEQYADQPDTGQEDDPLFIARKTQPLLQAMKDKILTQSLGGFNAAMLMQKETLQLPVDDPIGFADYQQFSQAVNHLVGGADQRAPNPLTDFSPIRTGLLQINQLRLVDTFGRIAELLKETAGKGPELIADFAGSSLGSVRVTDDRIQIPMPPRLAQAARLHFRWLSAAGDTDETNGQKTGSPVCGWLMANQLDRSLLVFDARGTSLGAIENETDTDGKARWRPAPGWESLTNPSDISNDHLRKVVAYLLAQGGTYIEKLIDETNAVLRRIEPETFDQQQALALLMGRPMALVRANIDLELKGMPAVHQGWNAFYRDRKDGNFERETDQYTKVRFPIRIGAVDQLNDGLIGYWLEHTDGSNALKSDLYLNNFAGADPAPNLLYLSEQTPISQSLDVSDPDQSVCILMDPRAKVHAFSGILPAKVIDIPADQYLDALKAIDITFLTTPILTPAGRISVPRPESKEYAWQWIEQTALKVAPQDKGQWLEIREYPAIPENLFLDIFSNILLQQIRQCNWLDTENKARTMGERAVLSPEFSLLENALKDLTPAGLAITPAVLYPVGQSLLSKVLLHKDIQWLVKAPTEGPEIIYRILPKESRASSNFNNTDFTGFESRINAILTNEYLGFRAHASDGAFFPEQVWIREGWLKLERGE